MQIPILLEPLANSGFRATAGQPLDLRADGATPEDAMRNLRLAVDDELSRGKQIVLLDVPAANPWLAMAGTVDPNDPLTQEWQEEMAAYRREKDNDPNWP
jgi:hypothetical protein